MSCQHQVETWLYYGICDLHFAFDCDYVPFDYHAAFFSIMALEKHMKARLIAQRKSEFLALDEKECGLKALQIAKAYSHKFQKMAVDVHPKLTHFRG